MARYGKDDKRLSAKEIVDRLGVGYYKILIEECQTRISNILTGRGDKSSEYTYRDDSAFKNRAEKERKVEELRRQIKKYEETIKEINDAISTINHSVYVLEQAAEKQALIRSLNSSLRDCFQKYEEKKDPNGKAVMIPSDTYDAIFRHKMFGDKLKSTYKKLWAKENNKIGTETRKVKKDIYKKIKKIYNLSVVDESDKYSYGYRYSSRYGSKDRYDYTSLNGALEDNNYSLEGFAGSLYVNLGDKYNSWDIDTMRDLGVEVDKVKRAVEISDGKERNFEQYGPILESIKDLTSEYNIYKRFKTLPYLREDMKVAEKLSREVECLDLIIDAYDNTAIKDTELFKELVEIYRKQNNKLNKLSRKVDEMYNRSGLKEYIEIEKKLRDLYHRAGSLRYQLSMSEEKLGYSDPETRRLNDLYLSVKSEMLGIVLKYPELNKDEYGIDLTKYDKKGRYIGEDEPKKEVVPRRESNPEPVEDEPFVPTVVVTEEELRRDLGMEEQEEPRRTWQTTDEVPAEEDSLDIPDHLTSLRTAYYSRYMVEKVKGSELGKMKFSEYLENVAPELEELIEIEKRRENKAKNVFKLYVQYLASLEDKSQAMRFSDFARLRHGLSADDLPYEYTDEEVKKRLSL